MHIHNAFNIFDALDLLSQAKDNESGYSMVIVDSYHRLFAPYLPAVDKAGLLSTF